MRPIDLLFISAIAMTGCNQKNDCPVCPTEVVDGGHVTDISGAFGIKLESKGGDCQNFDVHKRPTYFNCDEAQASSLEKLAPTKLYVVESGTHSVSIGIDGSCSGKRFGEHVYAHCLDSKGYGETSIWYDVTINGDTVSGTMNYMWYVKHDNGNSSVTFTRKFNLFGNRMR